MFSPLTAFRVCAEYATQEIDPCQNVTTITLPQGGCPRIDCPTAVAIHGQPPALKSL